jgi:hypothetical protein
MKSTLVSLQACGIPHSRLPQAKPIPARHGLRADVAIEVGQVGRYGNLASQSGQQKRLREVLSIRGIQVRQPTLVSVPRLPARLQIDPIAALPYQRLQPRLSRTGAWHLLLAMPSQLRGIETDQPDMAAIPKLQGIAIDDPFDINLISTPRERAVVGSERLGRDAEREQEP